MATSIREVLDDMKWGGDQGGLVSWKEMEEYWKDDKAWKSDDLTIEQCIKDVRILIANFKQLRDAAIELDETTNVCNSCHAVIKAEDMLSHATECPSNKVAKEYRKMKELLNDLGLEVYEDTTWLDRLHLEKNATVARIDKLKTFMNSPGLLSLSRDMELLMAAQLDAMRVYVSLLDARLHRYALECSLHKMPAE